jgi:uncharacterized metal-binding protein
VDAAVDQTILRARGAGKLLIGYQKLTPAGRRVCAAGLGGRIGGILKTTEAAEGILAIDGCPLNCVKSSLEQAGFTAFRHLQLADLGLEKCQSPVTEESINKVMVRAAEMIAS